MKARTSFIWLAPAYLLTLWVTSALLNMRLTQLDSLDIVPGVFAPAALRPEWLRFSTFGNSLSYIDWRWIRVLTDPGIEVAGQNRKTPLTGELDLATQVDPYFYAAYFYGAHLLSVVHNDGEGARIILERGLSWASQAEKDISPKVKPRYWPSTSNIATLLGYVYLFDVGDFEAASRSFERAAQDPAVAKHIRLLNRRLSTYEGRLEVAERVYNSLSKEDLTDKQRKLLNEKIATVRVLAELNALNSKFKEMHAALERKKGKAAFTEFLSKINHSGHDLLGGALYVDDQGEIRTQTLLHLPKGLSRDRSQ